MAQLIASDFQFDDFIKVLQFKRVQLALKSPGLRVTAPLISMEQTHVVYLHTKSPCCCTSEPFMLPAIIATFLGIKIPKGAGGS